ncbi:MAG TPA: hypothetical protein VN758_00520 [Solirubrobacterales bacterium]|nr:hypothetical protein [Solirubrobacterales bacterium]
MPGETAKFKVPYAKETDKPPSVPTITKAMADRLETLFGAVDLSQLVTGGEANDGKLLIVKDGVAAFKAMSGDATITEEGALSIGAKKIVASMIADALKPSAGAAAGTEALRALGATASTAAAGNDTRLSDERVPKANSVNSAKIEDGGVAEADLADKAVTSRKAKLTAGIIYGTGGTVATGGVYADVPGMLLKITPAIESKLFVVATFSLKTGATTNVEGSVKLDAKEEETQRAILYNEVGTASAQATVSQVYTFTLSAAEHTIQGRVRDGSSGNGEISPAHSSLLYFLVAA